MKSLKLAKLLFMTATIGAAFIAPSAHADDFYRGKSISVQVGFGAGGGYDAYGRLLARHLGRHIPGAPVLVPKNMPGAGSLKLANYLYNISPKDGTEMGIFASGVILEPLLGNDAAAQFDAKRLGWIGSLDKFIEIGIFWHTSKVQTIEEAMKTEVVVGSAGTKSGTYFFPVLLNRVLGTKFKIISGYQGTNDMSLALERGEISGFLGWCSSCILADKPEWVSEKKAKVFVQLSDRKDARFPAAPSVMDYIKNDEDRKVVELFVSGAGLARPFAAPPDVPADRLGMLRAAFNAVTKDPALLKDAKAMRLDINLVTGEEVAKLVDETYAMPKPVIEKAKAVFNQ